ncbi:LPS export ABC transporter periplasmic protein LptC [Petrachloros mirabilis]
MVYLLATNSASVPPPTTAGPGTISQADAAISHFSFTQTKGDQVQWQVKAREARLFEQDKKAVLDGVEVTLYGSQGREMTVQGDEGTLDTATKDFILKNRSEPLIIRTESGYTIYTNYVTWKDETREFRTEEPVRIVGHGLEVKGRGLLGHMDTEEFHVLEDVHVDLAPVS